MFVSFKVKHSQSGFTLVELAIVLMIIGLLIGGVLRGQELMKNAQVTATIQQVKAYQGAVATFLDSYSQLPGDMSNATTRIPNCSATSFCRNGNGDSFIGRLAFDVVQVDQTGTVAPQVETSMFWKHLSLAGLIAGINSAANPATPQAGVTHPEAKLRGAFVVATKTAGEPNAFASGPLFKLQMSPNNTGYSLSPSEAFRIDEKMDDGRPNSGFVAAENLGSGCKTTDDRNGRYAADMNDTMRCVLYFKL